MAIFDLTHARSKLAEDEPRCELLRQQKEELKQSLLEYRDLQTKHIEAVKTLKTERASLIQRRVRGFPMFTTLLKFRSR